MADYLSDEFGRLADQELIDHLRSGDLTQTASDIACEELARRGVDVATVLMQPTQGSVLPPQPDASALSKCITILSRLLCFPVRAIFGAEPLWAVIAVGVGFLYLLDRLLVYGAFTQFLRLRPMPAYALPFAYGGVALIALAMAWFAVALWRTATRVKSKFWTVAVRVLAILLAVDAVLATPRRVTLIEHFSSQPGSGSVMDTVPK
jgi:hypothetical protein